MLLTTCVFDAYGTLFDVNAAARTAANEPNRETFKEVWPSVSNLFKSHKRTKRYPNKDPKKVKTIQIIALPGPDFSSGKEGLSKTFIT